LNRLVQGVGYVVQIESFALKESLVERSCDFWTVLVVHEPAGLHVSIQRLPETEHNNLPHSPNDASEATKQHRRCQVDSLIGRVPVTLGSLTSAQDSEHSVWQVQVHDVLDCEVAVLQNEGAVEWVGSMNPMTGEMKNVSRRVL
jgi:hypothetical protein